MEHFVIAVLIQDKFELYGDENGNLFDSVEASRDTANKYFGAGVNWSVFPVSKMKSINRTSENTNG